ncbi:GerAB/ArcD/ProY family transporter [Solibacillus sp. FSL K6-1781]|uniref:Spore germination protein YndE n=1 Tax=Solibacillus isronensis B3W22 TaxID=1224748 RepID=K1LI02_9BACL|nr:GerAB/ArcD/ProY family transporter [Solibacillus isronensis]AMO86327.1 spore gernimation protein [Solibacillus silvestris]EKB44099.1 Spore germination protein YndE [Solibacillus isronensis B3W22]
MDKLQVNPTQTFNAPLLFFIICSTQIGVGIHGFQSIIYRDAKQDAWISIIISFIAAHIVVYIIFKVLELYESNDIYGVNINLFGKYLGNLINLTYIVYCGLAYFAIIKNYSDVINTWVFPSLSASFITITLLITVSYAFTGGLRVIIGVCFFSFFFSLWILVVLLFPIEYSNINYLLPVLNNDFKSLLKGAYSMTLTIVGFEIINTIYPYVKEKNKAQKYVHLGLMCTLAIYLFVMLVTLTFFSGEQLEKSIWATLSLFSIVRLPFLERIELITVCYWMMIILPNLCFFVWSAYRGVSRMINITDKKFVLIFSVLIFIGSLIVKTRIEVHTFNDYFGNYAFYIVFIYPIFIYFIALLNKKVFKRKAGRE